MANVIWEVILKFKNHRCQMSASYIVCYGASKNALTRLLNCFWSMSAGLLPTRTSVRCTPILIGLRR